MSISDASRLDRSPSEYNTLLGADPGTRTFFTQTRGLPIGISLPARGSVEIARRRENAIPRRSRTRLPGALSRVHADRSYAPDRTLPGKAPSRQHRNPPPAHSASSRPCRGASRSFPRPSGKVDRTLITDITDVTEIKSHRALQARSDAVVHRNVEIATNAGVRQGCQDQCQSRKGRQQPMLKMASTGMGTRRGEPTPHCRAGISVESAWNLARAQGAGRRESNRCMECGHGREAPGRTIRGMRWPTD